MAILYINHVDTGQLRGREVTVSQMSPSILMLIYFILLFYILVPNNYISAKLHSAKVLSAKLLRCLFTV